MGRDKEAELLEASRSGNLDYVKLYLKKRKSQDKRKKKPVLTHSRSYIHQQITRPTGINCQDWNGETALHLASLNCHLPIVELLLQSGGQVSIQDSQGCIPLHLAAWTGQADICSTLLTTEDIYQVNAQNKSGDTPLHIASQYGHHAVVRLLLKHCANPLIRNLRRETTLDLACFYGRLETVSILVNNQPALLQQQQTCHSPLHLAARNGQRDVVRFLLQVGYNINVKAKSGSALHEAVTFGKLDVAKILIHSGIDTSMRDSNGDTVDDLLKRQNTPFSSQLLCLVNGDTNLYHTLSEVMSSPKQKEDNSKRERRSLQQCSEHDKLKRNRNNSAQSVSNPETVKSLDTSSPLHNESSSSPTVDDSVIYDTVPTPYSLGRKPNTQRALSPPVSCHTTDSSAYCRSADQSFESPDSMYSSPSSLSPEIRSNRLKQDSHIYVNLSAYRSTPNLHSAAAAPKKPPRTETPSTSTEETDSDLQSDFKGRGGDYVRLKLSASTTSVFETRPHLILSQSVPSARLRHFSESPINESISPLLALSVPHTATNYQFTFPGEEDESDDHIYENMQSVAAITMRKPPKVTPRRSKGSLGGDTSGPLSSEAEDSITELREHTGVRLREARTSKPPSVRSTRVLDGVILDISEPLNPRDSVHVGQLLIEKRIPTFDEMSRAQSEDDYEDWKQIDGIFASMGAGGGDDLSTERFLEFLQRDSKKGTISDWLRSIGLGQYEHVLVVNGFDNINLLNGGILEQHDLALMGITNPSHSRRLLSDISTFPEITPIDKDNEPASVSDWLSSLDLTQYIDNFYSQNYINMSRIQQIWEVELSSVLGVTLLGHQKRILVSLSKCRMGGSGSHRGQYVTDVSHIVKFTALTLHDQDDEQIYFKHNFSGLQPKKSSPFMDRRNGSPALARSDSGCSIGSDGTRPDLYPHDDSNTYDMPPTRQFSVSDAAAAPPPLLPKKRGGSLLERGRPRSPHIAAFGKNGSAYPTQTLPSGRVAARSASVSNGAASSFDRSQSVKQITGGAGYFTMDNRLNRGRAESQKTSYSPTGSLRSAQLDSADFYHSEDYANLTETGIPVIGNVDGLKLSQAQNKTKRILQKIKRPLPNVPPGDPLTFTSADLPSDFTGIHKPEILIEGCVNYSSCYLGTCVVKDISGAESTREAIAKMKGATNDITKLPVVTLGISFKGVDFIDSASRRPICEHEITNIYCAAQDSELMNYFAYITKDVLTKGLYCHVFCVKSEELAREIIMTLGECFSIAYYAAKKDRSFLYN